MNTYELEPRFTNQKSFYGKAIVKITDKSGVSELYSYNTHVATFKAGLTRETDSLEVYGTYSQTTLKHIKEFMHLMGYEIMTKKEIEEKFLTDNITQIQNDMIKHAQEGIRKEAPWIL